MTGRHILGARNIFLALLLVTGAYAAVIVGFHSCGAETASLADDIFDATEPVAETVSRALPIVHIYTGKLHAMGQYCSAEMVGNVYPVTAMVLLLAICVSLLNIKGLLKEYEDNRWATDTRSHKAKMKFHLAVIVMFGVAAVFGYTFFFGDPLMEIPGRPSDNIHLNKWNILRGPIFGSLFYICLMKAIVVRKYVSKL